LGTQQNVRFERPRGSKQNETVKVGKLRKPLEAQKIIMKGTFMFLQTLRSVIGKFVKALMRLDDQKDTQKVLHGLQELCGSNGYSVKAISERSAQFGVQVEITVRSKQYKIFVKWFKDSNEVKRETNKITYLKNFWKIINLPELYNATRNFIVTEFIDGKTTSKDDVETLLYAVDHLVLIQNIDVKGIKSSSCLYKERSIKEEFLDFLNNVPTTIKNSKEMFKDDTERWLEQLQEIDQKRDSMFYAITNPDERDFVLSHGDCKPDNLLFTENNRSWKCYPVDWIYAALRPRWYDITSFTEGCSDNKDLEKAYWNRYCSKLSLPFDRNQAEDLYYQHKILSALRIANANANISNKSQMDEFSRSLNSLSGLLDKLRAIG
jgi:thiamine kinase-like enzyme